MKKDSFEKKLAAYVATAAAFLAAQKESNAQIMYTDVNPDLVINNGFFNLDLNNDGVVDFKLETSHQLEYGTGNYSTFLWFDAKVYPMGQNEMVGGSATWQHPIPVLSGDSINDQDLFDTNSILYTHHSMPSVSFSWDGNFGIGGDKILGMKMVDNGNTYYGWARLYLTDTLLVLKDYAINTIPDSSIIAGQANCNGNNYDVYPVLPQTICAGDTFQVNIINASGENIQWMNRGSWIAGENDTTLIVTQPGSYSALVTDSNCTIITMPAVFDSVYFNINPIADIEHEHCEQSNGSINITVSGNSPSYTYQWSNGVTTQDLNNIPAGIYTVTVTSSICSIVHSISRTIWNTGILPEPVISQDGNTLSINIYQSMQWYLNNSSISGSTDFEYIPQQNGYYKVRVTNDDGCSAYSDPFYFQFPLGLKTIHSDFEFEIQNKSLLFHLTDNALLGAQIEIINELGQLAASVTVTNQNPEADLSALPGGIYFFHIRSKQKTYSGKFFIE